MGKMADCIKDYEDVLQIRIQAHASDGQIGEALCELGFGYLRYLSPGKDSATVKKVLKSSDMVEK